MQRQDINPLHDIDRRGCVVASFEVTVDENLSKLLPIVANDDLHRVENEVSCR